MRCKASCFGLATQCTKAYMVDRTKRDNAAGRQAVQFLLADAETAENRIHHILRGSLAGDFSKRVVGVGEVDEK